MPGRCCVVSMADWRGARHTVEVEAETLYEAAALGIQRLTACDWIEGLGPATRLEVRQPTTRHELTVVVAKRLGHKKITTTLEIYAHALPSQQADAAERLGALLHG
jgi:integrase